KVTHFGFRELHQLTDDFRRWGRPRGAAFAKHLRMGVIYRAPLTYLWFHVKAFSKSAIRLRPPPQECSCLPAWVGGFRAGLTDPIASKKKQSKPMAGARGAEDLAEVTLRNQIPVQRP